MIQSNLTSLDLAVEKQIFAPAWLVSFLSANACEGVNMSSQIKKPEWFDLKKYENSVNANYLDWLINLHVRVMAVHYFDELEPHMKDNIKECRLNGFCSHSKLTVEDFLCVSHPIEKVSNCDIVRLYREMPEKIKKSINHAYYPEDNISPDEHGKRVGQYTEDEWEEIDNFLQINIHTPTELLLKDFKKWIVDKKKKNNIERPSGGCITPNKINNWAFHQVLGYLDLLIWAKITKRNITHAVFSDWLFPNNPSLRDNFRINTIKKANIFIENPFLFQNLIFKHELIDEFYR